MTATRRYALSFTSGSLLTQEALIAAPIYLREHDWAATRARMRDENLLQTRVARSNTRMLGALIPRLQML
ncbi:BrxA family protein, partial [Mycobacterium marinum]